MKKTNDMAKDTRQGSQSPGSDLCCSEAALLTTMPPRLSAGAIAGFPTSPRPGTQ